MMWSKTPYLYAAVILTCLALVAGVIMFATDQPRYTLAIQLTAGPEVPGVAFAQNPIDVKVPGGEAIKIIPVVIDQPAGGHIGVVGWLTIIAAVTASLTSLIGLWRIEKVHTLTNSNATESRNDIRELIGANKALTSKVEQLEMRALEVEKTRVRLADTTASGLSGTSLGKQPLASIKETVEDTNERVMGLE